MLTKQQLLDIEKLQKECENHDHIQLKLNWEMLRNRTSKELDFLLYENEELIAFLGLYPFGSTVEVCGMVKPSERRKNYFTLLFKQGMEVVKKKSFRKVLLNAPASSIEAKAFLTKQGAIYSFSEHQMTWEEKVLETVDGFSLRHANDNDLDMRIRLSVEAFGLPALDAEEMEVRITEDKDSDMLMIDVENETIGKIRIRRENGEAWIYGFSILPTHQGKGIGRKVLQQVVLEQSNSGQSVHLEVETKNAHALRLYESIGFKVVHAQDYYAYK
ncbi:GNAT family N-acetyltransferase [Bacillus sp. Cr_A10]|uniref:GNAT family N-acetyltransferase n=1 Tax=Bacillaceae TaxID=186817 RepID=UPI0023DA3612|nr:GNAT family N-acetyltransferase [Bacillus sp. Cr_A10]MDF2066933.1 GNAT family N-acetyltransferase [Bacillus sp. Cr_A10]